MAFCGLCLAAPSATAQNTPPSTLAARLAAMRELAQAITLAPAPAGRKADLISEPIYRFDDPAREFSDGTIWAFGKSGRPDALLCLSLEKNDRGELKWIHEMTSLSSGLVAASSRHRSARGTGTPRSPASCSERSQKCNLRPMTKAGGSARCARSARRFKVSESLDPARNDPSDRFELRLLPQPVLRYHDSHAGLVDGSIFLLAYGRNPEIALLIEAHGEATGDPAWLYGLAHIGAARFRVKLDDHDIADLPKPVIAGPIHPYFLFDRPAVGLMD